MSLMPSEVRTVCDDVDFGNGLPFVRLPVAALANRRDSSVVLERIKPCCFIHMMVKKKSDVRHSAKISKSGSEVRAITFSG